MKINDDELRFFAAAALSGYLANPQHATPQYAQHRKSHNTSLERMSVVAAANICQELDLMRKALNEQEHLASDNEAEKITPIKKEE